MKLKNEYCIIIRVGDKMKVKSYNTKSRKYILEFLEQNSDVTVSAKDIYEFVISKDSSINRATVYRYLSKLEEEKRVIKFSEAPSKKAVYQIVNDYGCDGHLHIKCVECGRLLHLDCGFMDELKEHLSQKHEFTLKCSGSILYGVCKDCSGNL